MQRKLMTKLYLITISTPGQQENHSNMFQILFTSVTTKSPTHILRLSLHNMKVGSRLSSIYN